MKATPSPRSSNETEEIDDMTSRVSPMRSDFHFYSEKYKEEVMGKIDSKDKLPLEKISELNERILQMWEKESPGTRSEYMMKEELDRTRFMNEDEIESRHCATLTSRPKSYVHQKQSSPSAQKDEESGAGGKLSGSKRQEAESVEIKPDEDYESPTKKNKENDSSDLSSDRKEEPVKEKDTSEKIRKETKDQNQSEEKSN